MKKITLSKNSSKTKSALIAGAAVLTAFTYQSNAQSAVDALLNKLEQKGILTTEETKALRAENEMDATNDFSAALNEKFPMSSWVKSYKIGGDFRGRFEQFSGNNSAFDDRTRLRYRLRFGVVASLLDNMEVGFRAGSGDPAPGSFSTQGNPLSQNSTMQNNWSDKGIYIDAAYAKWTAINSGDWLLAATIGKMDNPFSFTWMVFDPDLTPEGAAITGTYAINDRHSLAYAGAAFVLDEESSNTHDPFMYGGQILWNAKWSSKWTSSLGVGAFAIVSPEQLTTSNVPYVNQGNTRSSSGVLRHNYTPVIADASLTYTFDTAPLYTGAFPVKLQGEFMNNPGAATDNNGCWVGVTFGKSGKKHTWDLSYRYEYLEADAWYDQLVDDDSGAYYQHAPVAGGSGYSGGTNIKGHFMKFNYSLTDSLTFSATCYLNSLINQTLAGGVTEPQSEAMHFMADLMWKF